MDLMEDSSWTMRGLNSRMRGFLEQVNRLQEANRYLEGQISEWPTRHVPKTPEWIQHERTVDELRAQVGRLLMENAELALQSDSMKSRASVIQARCELEELQTKRLEQQVALLRDTKRRVEHTNVRLEADIHHSMTELQEIHQEHTSLQQQHRAASCDVLLVTTADSALTVTSASAQGPGEEDGTAMDLPQILHRIRTQCDRHLGHSGPDTDHPGRATGPTQAPGSARPSRPGATATARGNGAAVTQLQEEAAWLQVSLGGAALREARAELAEARKQWHSLQVEIESLHALEKGLENSLHHTQHQYSSQLSDLSQVVEGLEGELEQVRGGLATQRERHGQLLNTRMRLEREINTYRRLLELEEGRYPGRNSQAMMGLRPWRGPVGPGSPPPQENGLENGFSDPAVTPEDPQSDPLPVTHTPSPQLPLSENGLKKSPAILRRQKSLVILTEPQRDSKLRISTVKTQEIQEGNVVRESAEGHGTVETDMIDKEIKQWEGSFFKGNPKLRKKSVSLRFDLHMAAADEGCGQTKQDSLPDVEVRLVMKRSRSIPTIAP